MLLSVGEIIERIVIENIKIAILKQRIAEGENDPELYRKMMAMNSNRGVLVAELDRKIEAVLNGTEKNRMLSVVKTHS